MWVHWALLLCSIFPSGHALTEANEATVEVAVNSTLLQTFDFNTNSFTYEFGVERNGVLGTLSVNASNGEYSYVAGLAAGLDTVVWFVRAEGDGVVWGVLHIRVVRVQASPTGFNQTLTVEQASTTSGLLNVTSPNNAPAITVHVAPPTSSLGTLALNPPVPVLPAVTASATTCVADNTCVFSSKADQIRQQSIYTASELQAMGIARAGTRLTGVALHVAQTPDRDVQNLRVGVGWQYGGTLGTFSIAAFVNTSTVFTATTVTTAELASGSWFTVTFNEPVLYDGVSHLILDIATQEDMISTPGTAGGVYVKPVGGLRSRWAAAALNAALSPTLANFVMDVAFVFESEVVRYTFSAAANTPQPSVMHAVFDFTIDDGVFASTGMNAIAFAIVHCAVDSFGADCAACGCTMNQSQRCHDGFSGNGSCVCVPGFIGQQCELAYNSNGASLAGLSASLAYSPSPFLENTHRYVIVLPAGGASFSLLPLHSTLPSACTFINGLAYYPTNQLPLVVSNAGNSQNGHTSVITVVSAVPQYRAFGFGDVGYTLYVVQLNTDDVHTVPARIVDLKFGRTSWNGAQLNAVLTTVAQLGTCQRNQLFVLAIVSNFAPNTRNVISTTLRIGFIPLMQANVSQTLSNFGVASYVASTAANAAQGSNAFNVLVVGEDGLLPQAATTQDRDAVDLFRCSDGTFDTGRCTADESDTSFAANLTGRYVAVFILLIIASIFIFLALLYVILKFLIFDKLDEQARKDMEMEGRDNPQEEGDHTTDPEAASSDPPVATADISAPEGAPGVRRSDAVRPESRSQESDIPAVASGDAADKQIVIQGRTPPRAKDAAVSSSYDKLDDDAAGVDL